MRRMFRTAPAHKEYPIQQKTVTCVICGWGGKLPAVWITRSSSAQSISSPLLKRSTGTCLKPDGESPEGVRTLQERECYSLLSAAWLGLD